MYQLLLAIIYLAFISLGLPDSLVGAGWPVMHGDLGVPVSFAGFITVIIAVGTIASSLASERVTRRLGAGKVTAISVALTAAALFGFSTSTQFWMLCLWAIPYGIGAGAVDAALNNYVALHYAARHMNWLHSFWGVGASISPFIMSSAITGGLGWSGAYRTVGIIQAVLTVILIASLPLWGKVDAARATQFVDPAGPAPEAVPAPNAETTQDSAVDGAITPAPNHSKSTHVPLKAAVRIPGVVLVLVAFFAYCALESSTILWAATYLVSQRGVTPASAAADASLFLLGITAGRLIAGFFADRLGDRLLIRGGFLVIMVGILLLALPLPQVASLAGLVLAGLGAGPIYPAIIHSTPANFGADNSQAIIGIQMAAAYTGSTLAPPLVGAIATGTGMGALPPIVIMLAILGLVMSEALNRRALT